jgi:putative transposase
MQRYKNKMCYVEKGGSFSMSDTHQGKQRLGQRPQRKVLRLNVRDYSAPGFYFITICTLAKTQWLGDIVNDEICLSSAGKIMQSVWESLPQKFPGLELDGFVVMPNHVHGIILLTEHLRYSKPGLMSKPTLSKIIDTYKGAATYLIRRTTDIPDFSWQKSCYDIIMRNERALYRTRRYIAKNPERWIADRFYIRDI